MLESAKRMRKAGLRLIDALSWETGLKLKTDLAYMEMKKAIREYDAAVRKQKQEAL